MPEFRKKKITVDAENLAKTLQQERVLRKKNLNDVSKETKISVKYLQIIESGNFELLPGGLYGASFLQRYAKYLGLEKSELVLNFLKNFKNKKSTQKLFVRRTGNRIYFLSIVKIVRFVVLGFFVAVLVFYLGHYLHKLTALPFLSVSEPQDNLVIADKKVRVMGVVESGALLKINNKVVLPKQNGTFVKELDLKSGLNIIKISAKKKYSKENIISRKVFVDFSKSKIDY